MTAIAKFDKKRDFPRWQRRAEAHDPCLLSFSCSELDPSRAISDRQLRWKGFLTYWDSVADPLAGTQYVICTQPRKPVSPGGYFSRVGKHMAWVMRDVDDRDNERR